MRATRRAISVLPTPVGPIIRMFLGRISRCVSASSCWRRQRLRIATATARLASCWPIMKRSNSATIRRGVRSFSISPSLGKRCSRSEGALRFIGLLRYLYQDVPVGEYAEVGGDQHRRLCDLARAHFGVLQERTRG